MKKILSIILSVAFALTLMVTLSGCNDTNSSLANNINESVKRARTVLEQTPEVSNDELVFEEIMSLSKTNGSASATTISTKESNYVATKNDKVNVSNINNEKPMKRIPLPELDRQIVRSSDRVTDSTLGLISNDKLLTDKPNNITTARLNSRRVSDSSRLTSSHYVPRRISSVNYNNAGFVSYLGQVEDLYLMMNDAVCANGNINSCKSSILDCCDLLESLSQQLKSKEIELTDDQINSCKGLLDELGNCTNKVASSRNDVQNGCSSARQSTENSGFKVEKISSSYVKLINCLDSRESYYNSMLSCMNQLQAILSGNCYDSDCLSDDTINNTLTDGLNGLANSANSSDESAIEAKVSQIESDEDTTEENNTEERVQKPNRDLHRRDFREGRRRPFGNRLPGFLPPPTGNPPELNDDENNEETIPDNDEETVILPNTDEEENNSTILPNTDEEENLSNLEDNLNENSDTVNPDNEDDLNTDELIPVEDQKDSFSNIDTYQEQTIKPNVIDSRRRIRQNQNENQNSNAQNEQNLNNNTNQNNIQNGQITPNNGVIPNTNTYGLNGINNNVVGGVGVNGIGGVGAGVGVGGVGAGIGGVGGYAGVHNYENGIINPYRNTDTYKLAMASEVQPLPSETRRHFKPFTEIANETVNQNISIEKTTPLQLMESNTEINGTQEITTKTFKIA